MFLLLCVRSLNNLLINIPSAGSSILIQSHVSGVYRYSNGSIVEKTNSHMGAESPCFYGDIIRFESFIKHVPDCFGMVWFTGVGEARSVAMPGVCKQSELRDRENLSLHVEDGKIHLPIFVFEYT